MDELITLKLEELIRQQKITNIYLKELTNEKLIQTKVNPDHWIKEIQEQIEKL